MHVKKNWITRISESLFGVKPTCLEKTPDQLIVDFLRQYKHWADRYGHPVTDNSYRFQSWNGLCINLTRWYDDNFTDLRHRILVKHRVHSHGHAVSIRWDNILRYVCGTTGSPFSISYLVKKRYPTEHDEISVPFKWSGSGSYQTNPLRLKFIELALNCEDSAGELNLSMLKEMWKNYIDGALEEIYSEHQKKREITNPPVVEVTVQPKPYEVWMRKDGKIVQVYFSEDGTIQGVREAGATCFVKHNPDHMDYRIS